MWGGGEEGWRGIFYFLSLSVTYDTVSNICIYKLEKFDFDILFPQRACIKGKILFFDILSSSVLMSLDGPPIVYAYLS